MCGICGQFNFKKNTPVKLTKRISYKLYVHPKEIEIYQKVPNETNQLKVLIRNLSIKKIKLKSDFYTLNSLKKSIKTSVKASNSREILPLIKPFILMYR